MLEMKFDFDGLIQLLRNASMRLVLNAGNPMVRRLAQQEFENPDVFNLMLGIYNSAILYNQELMTPQNARIFYEQFQTLMSRSLDYIIGQADLRTKTEALEKEREALRKHTQRSNVLKHLIFFLMTPLDHAYQPFIETVRDVIENRCGCQLFVASDRQYQDMVIDNVRSHMDQAHAFIAEVTDANPNVMFELGAARFDLRERPIVLMRRNTQQQLPADLHGRIYVNYDERQGAELADFLEQQLRADQRINALLQRPERERYISPKFLKQLARFPHIDDKIWQALADQYPTQEAWQHAAEAQLRIILGAEEDLADVMLARIQRGVSTGQQ